MVHANACTLLLMCAAAIRRARGTLAVWTAMTRYLYKRIPVTAAPKELNSEHQSRELGSLAGHILTLNKCSIRMQRAGVHMYAG